MSVEYRNLRAEVAAGSRSATVSFVLENHSQQAWHHSEGFALGYQIFDPDTGMFVIEGEWLPLAKDLAPAETETVELPVVLPPEKGRYHVYISPRDDQHGWLYHRGSRFVLVAAVVENGEAQIAETAVTTVAQLRRRRFRRSALRMFTQPFTTVWNNWSLIRSMVRRDISARYRGSFGEMFWTILNPLLLMGTYFFVFGIVLQSKFSGDNSPGGFVLYFLAGMLPWLPFSEALGRAPQVIVEHRNYVKKLVFPVEVLPIDLVLAGLVTGAVALVLFVVFLFFIREAIPWTIAWLPALIIPQILLTLGACWFLAAIGVYVRDLAQVMGFVLTLWFFLTPICYPEASLPRSAMKILGKNPLYTLVRGYRSVLLENHAPELHSLWKLWFIALLVMIAGYASFYKLRKSFADVI